MISVKSKLKAIRGTPLPTVEECKQKLKHHVSDNGQFARQGLSTELYTGIQSILQRIPDFVGLKQSNLPTLDKLNGLTGTGLMT